MQPPNCRDGGGADESYEAFRWKVLRPDRSDRSTCMLEDPGDGVGAPHGGREFVVKFRTDSERVAYWNLVKRRLCARFQCEAPPVRVTDTLSRCDFPCVTGDMYDHYR